MVAGDDAPQLTFATKADFRAWLEVHVGDQDGLWLKVAKKGSGVESIAIGDALDVALAFGWIDAQRRPYDDTYYLQRYVPRRARSRWSKINTEKIASLVERGEMTPYGIAEVDRAKADGRWDDAYEPASRAQVPADFLDALEADPAAKATFATITSASRFAIVYRLHDAKRPETRARRLRQIVDQLAAGDELSPPAPRKGRPT